MVYSTLHEACYVSLVNGIILEKNRVVLSKLNRIGTLKPYQVYSDRNGKTYTELFSEIDPAVEKFLEISS